MKRKNQLLVASLCFMFVMMLAACGQSNEAQETSSAKQINKTENSQKYEPVTIQNGARTIEFTEMPKRAVTLNQHATEVMLALGLEKYMVGTAYLDDDILPEYKDKYSQIPVISDEYPSQEAFLEVNPDFAYAGWKSAFQEDAIGTFDQLEKFGIKAYLHQSSNIVGPKSEDVYEDIRNIARIFHVEERADKLIKSINNEVENIQDQIGSIDEPLRVFVYDSGEDAPVTATQNFMTELIRMAGGKNIFSDIEKNWANVTWEEVVKRNPEVIVIIDYGDIPIEKKKQTLLNKTALADVEAIQKERFTVLPLSAAAEGVRIPIAVETLAKSFYPDKFE
ncbi:Fe3+-hydroxamate ABC transporter substrate-binding protein [Pueribacillus theae]|uniref:Fe3+-hydroxamate ABC transporter substrate-binding protein n=1 Tax=Pueribacillus theae TaxID=2171751 RepID=A0A2U1K457_9BACI|nr:ABC transporter substrate-binding protein [Pueribacillus theae]PWA12192.1 Fe3+-hydroxamate ABC transporter substrate-binding protein [Pueribacillus theae]